MRLSTALKVYQCYPFIPSDLVQHLMGNMLTIAIGEINEIIFDRHRNIDFTGFQVPLHDFGHGENRYYALLMPSSIMKNNSHDSS